MLSHLKRAALIGQLHIAIGLAHVTWVIRFMLGCTIQPLCRLEEDWMKRRREEEERRRWGGGEEELHSKFLGHCYRDKNINERCRLWHMEIVVPKDGPEKILFAIALQDIFRVSSISQKRSGSNHKSREKTQLINYNYNYNFQSRQG